MQSLKFAFSCQIWHLVGSVFFENIRLIRYMKFGKPAHFVFIYIYCCIVAAVHSIAIITTSTTC